MTEQALPAASRRPFSDETVQSTRTETEPRPGRNEDRRAGRGGGHANQWNGSRAPRDSHRKPRCERPCVPRRRCPRRSWSSRGGLAASRPGTAPSVTAGPCRFRSARSLAQPPPEREDGVTEAQVRGVTPCGARAAPTSLHRHVAPASQELGAELLPPGRVPCRCFSVWNITVQWSEKFSYSTSIVPSF